MIVLLGSTSGPKARANFAGRNNIGILVSPEKWARPWTTHWACDNAAYPHRFDPDWWCRDGETRWYKMLDKIPSDNPPMFVLLPDVVYDWQATLERAWKYLPELRARRLPVAVALQEGSEADLANALRLRPDVVFVGGDNRWKWRYAESICRYFQPRGIRVHVGRTSGPRRIRECLRIGADSCDGTGWIRYSEAMLPGLWRELDGTSPQGRLEL